MAKNQALPGGMTSRRFVKCPATVKSGDPMLVGKMPAVALDDYQSKTGGTTVDCSGSFVLPVMGATVISPLTGLAIKAGDKVYATGGSLDAATNVTTGFTLTGATGDPLFGFYDPQENAAGITSGATNANAVVKLNGSE